MSGDSGGKPRMSLYANLLKKEGPDAPGTISGAPVVYKKPGEGDQQSPEDIVAAAKAKLSSAALRFQPTKRPQISSKKPKPLGAKVPFAASQATQPAQSNAPAHNANQQPTKTTIDDWTGDPDDDFSYQAEKRQRGGRKKRKKNKETEPLPVNWDDIYDPSRPNNFEEYKNSEEAMLEVREWKDRLYAHRVARRKSSYSDSSDEDRKPSLRNQFAPPGMSFAPPSDHSQGRPTATQPLPGTGGVQDDPTGDDAYARRIRLSQQQAGLVSGTPPPPPPQASDQQRRPDISRAPVRYNLPPPPSEIPENEAELESALQLEASETNPEPGEIETRSTRPGQKGFAERLMNKYGWTKGSGLGAQGTGITSALRVKVEKQKRKPDSEGGGFVGPGGRGKIIGGKKQDDGDEGKFGAMSEVIILHGMVDGLDLQHEMGEGNLMQEIGEECGDKYGRVERVFIDQNAQGSVPVFVKFTSALSALRAVNALEGRIFNGNPIKAKFYDKDMFNKAEYSG